MKMVYNKGIYTKGKYTSTNNLKSYKIWKSMLQRCYDNKSLIKFSTYIGCKVCDEWLYFQNFAKWFVDNYVDGYTLDKDILGNGKLYNPKTCCFVPNRINNIFHRNRHLDNGLGQGVRIQGNRFRVEVNTLKIKRKHIGYFETKEEAKKAYIEAKIRATDEILEYYQLDNRILKSIKKKII